MKEKKKKTDEGKNEFEFLKHLIEKKGYGHCYICHIRFGRIRITENFCYYCNEWFCAEHGSFAGKKVPFCLIHDEELKKLAEKNLNTNNE
ncbi:MAG: hypothetical protein IPL48_07380 [Bacteroidetes bacterium]|nr:hypothetical protein [Bacteroidota bacterium]